MDKDLIKKMREAIKQNDISTIKYLIDNNNDWLNVETVFGTFFHEASRCGKYDVAKYFVDCGIDVNKKGGIRGGTALTLAAFVGNMNIVEMLYENGAILDVSNFPANPLFAAIYNNQISCSNRNG